MAGNGLAIRGFNRAATLSLSGFSVGSPGMVLTLYAAMSYQAVLLNFVTPLPVRVVVSGGGRGEVTSGGGRAGVVAGGGRGVNVTGGNR